MGKQAAAAAAADEGDADSGDELCNCALVEFSKGAPSRKWSLVLGQTYVIGRAGSGADIEVDHASLSRRHCSLALTKVDDELILVALDKGSTNGTFVNKQRLENGVGMKQPVKEVRHLSFGECQNGYRIVVQSSAGEGKADALSSVIEISDGPDKVKPVKATQRDWKAQAEEALKMKAMSSQNGPTEAKGRKRRVNLEELCGPADVEPAKKTRSGRVKSAWRLSDVEAFAAKVKGKSGAAPVEISASDSGANDIEWPEDWR